MVKVKYQTAKISSNVLLGCALILIVLAILMKRVGKQIDEHNTLIIVGKGE